MLQPQLTAIDQLLLQAKMLGNRGLPQFDEQDCKQSIEAIKQTGGLVGRVRFREGLPHLQVLGTLLVGENGGEILANDLRL